MNKYIPINKTPKSKPNLWLGVLVFLIIMILFAFSPLIIPAIFLGLDSLLGFNKFNNHDLAVYGWAIFVTLPLAFVGLIAGVIFFVAQFRLVEKEFPSLKCSRCGKLTSINWGNSKMIFCEDCVNITNQQTNN